MQKLNCLEAMDAWVDNQALPLTSEGFVELSYKISDPDLQKLKPSAKEGNPLFLSDDDLFPSDDDDNSKDYVYPRILDEVERSVEPYATLETDLWRLDGSRMTVPKNGSYKYSGYISNELCEENKEFKSPPLIIITFKDEAPSVLPGLTITWGTAFNEYPIEFETSIKRGNSVIGKGISFKSNNPLISMVVFEMDDPDFEMDVSDKIEIKILKWCRGQRRARVSKIFLGFHDVYQKDVLMNFSCSEGIDPISSSLPKYEISFEIDNRDGNFNPLNKKGLTKFMMERQEIKTRYGYQLRESGDGNNRRVWIDGGVYYLSDWNAPQNGLSASFKARDLLGFLNDPYYKGRFPTEEESDKFDGIPLRELAKEVLKEADLPRYKDGDTLWSLEGIPEGIITKSPLPICSLAECLQLITNASCCTIFFDRYGKINIAPLGNTCEDLEIYKENSYTKPEISLTKPVKQIDISQYSYVEDGKNTLYDDMINLNGDFPVVIEYSDIAQNVKVFVDSQEITDDDDRVSIYAKCCILNPDSRFNRECKVTITGTVFKQAESIVTIQNNPTGEIQPLKNILITDNKRAEEVGEWLKDHLKCRKHASVDWRIDPRVDIGDIVKIGNFAKLDEDDMVKTEMRITSNSFSFNGAFKGKSEGVMSE